MALSDKNNNCKRIRSWLGKALDSRLSIRANWVQSHVAQCPRCRRRLSGFSRVFLGFQLIKSQTHPLDLLRRANHQAISVLQRSVREIPQAEKLRRSMPQPALWSRLNKYAHSISNTAACLVILLMLKTGIFSSMDKFQSGSYDALKHYYSKNVGDDLADEIFLT